MADKTQYFYHIEVDHHLFDSDLNCFRIVFFSPPVDNSLQQTHSEVTRCQHRGLVDDNSSPSRVICAPSKDALKPLSVETGLSDLGFLGCLTSLDRIESRVKRGGQRAP